MRRMIALLLTSVLCLQLCVPAFATETVEEVTDVTVADEEELTSETEETAEATTDETEATSSETAVETDGTDEEVSAAEEETEETEASAETDEAETAAEAEDAAASGDVEEASAEAAEEDTSDSSEEDVTLYSGFEADYNDPEFLQLLENGAFDESEDDGVSTAATYSHGSQFNGYTITKGVDVSKWNGTINWSKVKASGISFVIIRCGYRGASDGTLYKDAMFDTNVKGALAAGLEVGVYVYSQAITTSEAKAEANLAIQMCAGYDVTLPLVLDYEYYDVGEGRLANASLTKTQRTNICLAFCDTVDAAGYGAMVYANRSMLEDDTYGQQIADAGYEVWVAQWRSSTTYSGTYTYWQYSDSGSVSGIPYPTSGVDMNYRYELPSPTITLTYCAAAGVRLAWSKVSLADSYAVYRRTSGETAWTKLGTVSSSDELTWLDETAVEGTTYEYVVRACDGSVLSPYQRTGTSVDYEPEFSLASATQTSSGVKLTWEASSDYDSYQIYRRVGYSGSWTKVTTISDTSKTSYTDTAQLTGGTVYSYTIVGVSDGAEDDYDTYGIQVTWLGAPELVSAASYKSGMRVTWKAVSGADGYRVYRKENGSWTRITTITSSSTVTYYDSAASTSGTTYTYTVRAYRGSVSGPYSSSGVSGTRIAAPTLVSAALSGSSMKVQWKAVSGATEYRVYRKSSGTGWTKIATTAATSYTDTTAVSGTVYTYTVRAVVSGNVSWFDETGVSGLYLGTAKLSYAYRTSTGASIAWETVDGATKYAVYRKTAGGKWSKIATVTSTSYADKSTLSSTGTYYYTVRAISSYNGSTVMGYYETSGLLLTTLSIPSLVSVTSNKTGGLTVEWKSVSKATGYVVYRKSGSGTWKQVATTSGTSWTDTSVKSGTVYTYTVGATDGQGRGGYNTTGISGVWLATPTLSGVSSVSTGLKVSWGSVSGATKYYVYRKTSGSGWTRMATVTSGTTWTDTTVKSGTVYIYTVRAVSGSGTSWYDTTGVSGAWLATPTLTSVSTASNGVKVQWKAVTGATSYRVYRKTEGGSWTRVATVTGTSYTDTSLTAYNTNYYYTVRAYTTLNGTTWCGSYDKTGLMIHYLETPALSGVSSVSTGLKVSWGSVSGATKYYVYRKTSGSGWTRMATVTSGTTWTDTTVKSGTVYIYTVRAVSGSGTSWYDTTGVSGVWLSTPTLTSVSTASNGVKVQWKAVTGATSYRVYRKTEGGSWTRVATVTGTSCTDTSLTAYNTNYYYTVRAYTTLNGTTWCGSYDKTGLMIHYLETPALSGVSSVSTGLKVSWGSVSGATKYYVYRKTSGSGWTRMATVTSGTTWTDTTAESGTVYTYTVRAGSGSGTGWYDTTGVSGICLSTPTLTSVSTASNGVKVQWKAVTGATSYRVYRKTEGGSWTRVATVTGTSYTDTSLTAYNTNYYYTVRAYTTLNGTTWCGSYDKTGLMIHYLAVPQLVEASSNEAGIEVSWIKVSGATSYLVYRKTSDTKWTKIATLDSSAGSYTDTTGVSGTTYYYTVRAKSANGQSWYDATGVSAICR